jgi:hypothetical protein
VNGEKQYRYTLCGEGYLAQSSNSEFFGVGTATTIDYVKVTWLSGIEDILYNVSVNQTLSILEGSETLSVNMASEQSQLLVYPTIFENHVYLEGSNNEIGEISIYDMLGKQIYQEGMKHLYSKKLNLSELTSGVYFLQRDSQNGSQIFKIIKK